MTRHVELGNHASGAGLHYGAGGFSLIAWWHGVRLLTVHLWATPRAGARLEVRLPGLDALRDLRRGRG